MDGSQGAEELGGRNKIGWEERDVFKGQERREGAIITCWIYRRGGALT